MTSVTSTSLIWRCRNWQLTILSNVLDWAPLKKRRFLRMMDWIP